MIKSIIILVLTMGFILTSFQASAQSNTASEYVSSFSDEAILLIKNDTLDIIDQQNEFRRLLTSKFNVPAIGKFILGRYWNTISSDEQSEYLQVFEDYIVITYGSKIKSFSGKTLIIINEIQNNNQIIVQSQLLNSNNSDTIRINWQLVNANNRWYIVDASVEGISMAVTLRSDFASVIRRNGIDGLLKAMRNKINKN